MGIATGAYQSCRINEKGEVLFERDFDSVEKELLLYPNGEFVRLADAIEEVSNGEINLRNYFFYDDVEYENPDYTSLQKDFHTFTFDEAIKDGEEALAFIHQHKEKVQQAYRYTHDPVEVLEYLLQLWENHYYVKYCL